MPTLHREAGFAFHFFAADGNEAPHVHVRGHGHFGKVWLAPEVRMEKPHGYTPIQVGRITAITKAHRDEWRAAWEAFFRGD